MQISDNYRKLLVKEINFAAKTMDESKLLDEKVFYFSAIFGIIQRIINFEYSPDLIFAHKILTDVHTQFQGAIAALKQGRAMPRIEDEHVLHLQKLTVEFGKKVKEKKPLEETLKKFAILSYSLAGNGYYLHKKGVLKLN